MLLSINCQASLINVGAFFSYFLYQGIPKRIHRFRLQEPCYVIPESRQTLLFQIERDQSKALIAHRSTRSAIFSHIQFQEKTKTKNISHAGLNFNRAIV